jgi:hypothetical protein
MAGVLTTIGIMRLFAASGDAQQVVCPPTAPSLVATGVHWNGSQWNVCQHSVPGGSLYFIGSRGSSGRTTIEIQRSAEALYTTNSTWLGFTEDAIKNSVKDLMGNRLLERGNPTFAEIRASAPPLVMSPPDSIKGDPPTGTAHTFVSSRSSSMHASFDVVRMASPATLEGQLYMCCPSTRAAAAICY